MNEKDDIILEYLDSISPSAEPPAVIYFNINRRDDEFDVSKRTDGGFSKNTLHNRIELLEDLGLVKVVREKGRYRCITEEGRAYLEGEYDAGEGV